jgi:anti-anti-sigma factor
MSEKLNSDQALIIRQTLPANIDSPRTSTTLSAGPVLCCQDWCCFDLNRLSTNRTSRLSTRHYRRRVDEETDMPVVGFRTINDHLVVYFKSSLLTDPNVLLEVEKQIDLRVERINLGRKVVINFDGVDAASSQMVGILLGVKKKVVDRLGTLTLCRLGEQLEEVLKLTRLDRQFRIEKRMRDVVGTVTSETSARPMALTSSSRSDTAWID